MGFDLYPLTTLGTKKKLLPRMVDESWLLIFEHEAFRPLGRIHREGEKYVFREDTI